MRWHSPAFWQAPEPGVAARLLAPLGALYGAAAMRRMEKPGWQAPIPVLCIGNFTLGGAGKTPTALTILALMQARGFAPAVISRGYGGRLTGPLVVSASGHTSQDVGDEPLMMARRGALVIVARDRAAGVAHAAELGASLAILDDGLQNPSVAKDAALAVFDGAVGMGNGLCVPAGPLRAPPAAQWARTHAALIIGEGQAGQDVAQVARSLGKPVFRGRLAPDAAVAAGLVGQPVLALAGIGRPAKFAATLAAIGARVTETAWFPDHHPYSALDIDRVATRAVTMRLPVVTTEKDATRLGGLWDEARHGPLIVLPVELRLENASEVAAYLDTLCQARFADPRA